MTTHSTELEAELDEILAEYLTWKGEAIHIVNQTENYKRMKQALSTLIAQREQAAELRGVSTGMARAKTAVTVAMNTGSSTMTELRAVIDKEIKWWDENMVATKPEKGEEE